jgi:ABC-type Fe3+/spermidine/putrescine transport system ATPase subunit
MPNIRIEKVSKRYGDIHALDGMEFEVKNGEYLCLLGPTGAGKTTTLRLIAGLIRPDEGTIRFDGKDARDLEPEERKAALLSQTYSLFPQMTVAENILFGPEIRGVNEQVKARTLAEMLDLVRLSDRPDALPKELSGGMQQRTALARALASGANVLLLDEPLRALDARLRISLRYELRSLAKSLKITTVHVTHDQDEALVMADRIAIIREGRIVQIGDPAHVFDDPVSPFVANFVGQSNFFVGKVIRSGETTLVRGEDERVVAARPSAFPEGAEVVVGVKVGNTEVSKEGEGFLRGRIERILFEGRNLHVDIDLGRFGRYSSKIPSWRMRKLLVGDLVNIKWAPGKASVFAMPPQGLGEELRVE